MTMRARTTQSACARKVSYPTEDEAQAHLDALDLIQPFAGHRIYLCNRCGCYHVAGGPRHSYTESAPRRGRRRRIAYE